jgi:hypothetical protein
MRSLSSPAPAPKGKHMNRDLHWHRHYAKEERAARHRHYARLVALAIVGLSWMGFYLAMARGLRLL